MDRQQLRAVCGPGFVDLNPRLLTQPSQQHR
jgi:hypothetical protein